MLEIHKAIVSEGDMVIESVITIPQGWNICILQTMDAKSVGLENMDMDKVNFNDTPWNLSSRSFCMSAKTFCCIFLCCFAPSMPIAADLT